MRALHSARSLISAPRDNSIKDARGRKSAPSERSFVVNLAGCDIRPAAYRQRLGARLGEARPISLNLGSLLLLLEFESQLAKGLRASSESN